MTTPGNLMTTAMAVMPHKDVERALEVARIVMSRRGCRFTEAHAALFKALSGGTGPTGRTA